MTYIAVLIHEIVENIRSPAV